MSDQNLKEKILNWIEKRLEAGEDFFLPLKKLHQDLKTGLNLSIPPPEEIGDWIREDERFNLITIQEDPMTPAEEKKLEKLGFYRGPRVDLKDRQPSPSQAMELLSRQSERLISSLQNAYQARPREGTDRNEIEDNLLHLLRQAQQLKNKITDLGLEKGNS